MELRHVFDNPAGLAKAKSLLDYIKKEMNPDLWDEAVDVLHSDLCREQRKRRGHLYEAQYLAEAREDVENLQKRCRYTMSKNHS